MIHFFFEQLLYMYNEIKWINLVLSVTDLKDFNLKLNAVRNTLYKLNLSVIQYLEIDLNNSNS